MEVTNERCCGLDVHKDSTFACVNIHQGGRTEKELRRFGTMAGEMEQLREWLLRHKVTVVAMEATGVYWKPVWNALADHMNLLLVNPEHLKAIPGKKTDFKDGSRIADLLQHGLLRGSFVPSVAQRRLRDLTRSRTRLAQEMARVENRLQKVLEDAGVKLASVASSVVGLTGRRILEAIIAGETNPEVLANLACGKLRSKIPQLRLALEGRLTEHHQFQLNLWLRRLRGLESDIAELDRRLEKETEPFRATLTAWSEVPGVSRVAAVSVLAEIGPDMRQFPTAQELASWACLCPGNKITAGKRISGRTRKGNPWLRAMLCQAAWAASHARKSYFQALFRRIAKRNSRKALLAVAHSLLVTLYHVALDGKFHDLGRDYFDRLDQTRRERYLVRQLQNLGHRVTLMPLAG
jgi:transposase